MHSQFIIQMRVGFTDGKPSWQRMIIFGGIHSKEEGVELLERLRASGGTYRLRRNRKR